MTETALSTPSRTILAYTSPAMGHLYPMMPLLLELRARGHDVHVRTLGSLVDQVRAAGLKAEPIDERLDPLREAHPDYAARSSREALAAAGALFCERGHIDGPDLERAVDETGPDVLVVDTNAWGAVTAATAGSLPWAQFAPYLVPIASRGTPPFGPGLAPMAGPLGRLRDGIAHRLVMGAVTKAFAPRFNELRTAYGLPAIATYDEFILGAPLFLVNTSSEYQADEVLARVAIDGLADECASVVITMPAGVPGDLGPLPPNVRVERFVPHQPLLERAAVAVTHGGMGSTQKALAAGVPVCVVPFGRDQIETAARVVHAQAGTRLSKRRLSPQRLRDAVRDAATRGAGAHRVAAGYRAAGGAARAADLVELLCGRASPIGGSNKAD